MRVLALTTVILLLMAFNVSAISVCDNCEFTVIQDAVDFAGEGDVVEVGEGVFMENIVIDKSIELKGSDSIISPQTLAPTVTITADNVKITGFHIPYSFTGVQVEDADNVSIENCFFEWDSFGVRIIRSAKISVRGNLFKNINTSAIYLDSSSSVLIENNSVERAYSGVFASSSSESIISGNKMDVDTGIIMVDSIDNVIEENKISAKDTGITLFESGGNKIDNNSVNAGIFLDMFLSSRNSVSMNSAECKIYARSINSYNTFEFAYFNLSGEEFEFSFFEAEVPGYDALSKGINVTLIPNIYTDRGSAYIEARIPLKDLKGGNPQSTGLYNITSTPYMVSQGSIIERNLVFNATITESGFHGVLVEKVEPPSDVIETKPSKTTTTQTIILVLAIIFALAVLVYVAKRK